MAKIPNYFSIALSIVILNGISVDCHNFNEFKRNLFSIRTFDITSIINETVFWTQNRWCLGEINAIKIGLTNYEEWAFRSKWKSWN